MFRGRVILFCRYEFPAFIGDWVAVLKQDASDADNARVGFDDERLVIVWQSQDWRFDQCCLDCCECVIARRSPIQNVVFTGLACEWRGDARIVLDELAKVVREAKE